MIFKERLYLFAAAYGWWQRYVGTLLVVVMLLVFWWFMSFHGLYLQLQQQTLHRIQEQSVASQALTTKKLARQKLLQSVDKQNVFFVCKRVSDAMSIILESMHKYKLKLISSSVPASQPYETFFSTDITFIFEGDFFATLSFFESLDMYSNMVCQCCEMESAQSDIIRCTVVMRLYTQQ